MNPQLFQTVAAPLQRKGAQWSFLDPAVWDVVHKFLSDLKVAFGAQLQFLDASDNVDGFLELVTDGVLHIEGQTAMVIDVTSGTGGINIAGLISPSKATNLVAITNNADISFSSSGGLRFRGSDMDVRAPDANTLEIAHAGTSGVVKLNGNSEVQLTGGTSAVIKSLKDHRVTGSNKLFIGDHAASYIQDFASPTGLIFFVMPSVTYSAATIVAAASGAATFGSSGSNTDIKAGSTSATRFKFPTVSYIEATKTDISPASGKTVDLGVQSTQEWENAHIKEHTLCIQVKDSVSLNVASGEIAFLDKDHYAAWTPNTLIAATGDISYDDTTGEVTVASDDTYLVDFTLHFEGTSSNNDVTIRLREDGTVGAPAIIATWNRTGFGNGDVRTVSFNSPISVTDASNKLKLTVEVTAGSIDLNPDECDHFSIRKIP